MYKRVWSPINCERSDTESKITIYDFGVYYGELVGDDWTCWEILSRVLAESGEITEELRAMPQDWVPFDSYYKQTYTGHISGDNTLIRGWSIRTMKHTNHLPDPPQQVRQEPQVRQAPQVRQEQPRQVRQQQPRQAQQVRQAQPRQVPQVRQPPQVRQAPQQKILRRNMHLTSNTKVAPSAEWTPLIQVAQPI